jgi:hypothetical protein
LSAQATDYYAGHSQPCLSSLIEAVRDQTRIVDLKQVNRARKEHSTSSKLDIPQNVVDGH